MKFEIFKDKENQYRWHLVAHNGKLVASSGEAYTRRSSCNRAVKRVMEGVAWLWMAESGGKAEDEIYLAGLDG